MAFRAERFSSFDHGPEDLGRLRWTDRCAEGILTSLAEGTGWRMQSSQHLQMSVSSTWPGCALAPRRWMARRRSWQYISSRNDRNAMRRGRPPPTIAPSNWNATYHVKKINVKIIIIIKESDPIRSRTMYGRLCLSRF